MTVNTQKPIVIFRGDNTAAFDLRTIKILLTGDLDLTNATARFDLLDFTKSWTTEEVATGELSIVFDSSQTKSFALGPQTGTLRLYDMSTGTPRQLTIVNKIPFFVTNRVCDIENQNYEADVCVTSGEVIHVEFNVGLIAIAGKADKVSNATAGDLASLTADGNLEDSGIPKTDVLRKTQMDSTPTLGSQNPVTSDGIKQAIEAAKPSDYEQVKQQVQANKNSIATINSKIPSGASPSNHLVTLQELQEATPSDYAQVKQQVATNTQNISRNTGDIADNKSDISGIKAKIPAQASAQNQLADKAFVNSSIATNTATFRGSYNLVSDLGLTVSATEQQVAAAIATKLASLVPPIVPENNDYCFVQVPKTDADPTVIERIDRYKCTVAESGGVTTRVWEYEWSLNNSSFTADQWAAINSGITSGLVEKLNGIEAGAQVNTIQTVKVNGTALTPDNKAVDVPVPVQSVNSKTGAVVLSASDVGAIPISGGLVEGNLRFSNGTYFIALMPGDAFGLSGPAIGLSDGLGNILQIVPTGIKRDNSAFIAFPSVAGTLALLSDMYAAVQQIAPAWVSGTAYTVNALVSYNGVVYRCKTDTVSPHTAAPNTDTTHWEAKKVSELFLPLTGGMMQNGAYIRFDCPTTAFGRPSLFVDGDTFFICASALGSDSYRFRSDAKDQAPSDEDVLRRSDFASPAFTGTPTAPTPAAGDNSTKVATTAFVQNALPYAIGAAQTISTASQDSSGGTTIDYGEATLADRTVNQVAVTASLDELRVSFPAAVSNKVRDFELRLEVGTGSAALTAPAIVVVPPTGETITLENADGTFPTLEDGTATAKGVTTLYFSETATGKFLVKGEAMKEVA